MAYSWQAGRQLVHNSQCILYRAFNFSAKLMQQEWGALGVTARCLNLLTGAAYRMLSVIQCGAIYPGGDRMSRRPGCEEFRFIRRAARGLAITDGVRDALKDVRPRWCDAGT